MTWLRDFLGEDISNSLISQAHQDQANGRVPRVRRHRPVQRPAVPPLRWKNYRTPEGRWKQPRREAQVERRPSSAFQLTQTTGEEPEEA